MNLRLYDCDDEPRVLELLATGLGPGRLQRTSAAWRWKHEQGPFGRSYVLVCEDDGQIVGLRAFLRWRFERDGQHIEAVRPVDTVVHPEWRRRGLFTAMTRELVNRVAEDGVRFAFNTPNSSSRPGYLKLGWRDAGRCPALAKPQWRRLLGTAHGGHDDDAGADPTVGGMLAKLPVAVARPDRFTTPRTAAYLKWRYADAPGIRYRLLVSADRTAALVTTRTRRGRWTEERICESLILGAGGDRELLRLVAQLAHESPAHFLTAIASQSTLERSLLVRSGFLPLSAVGPRLVHRGLGEGSGAPSPPPWALSAGDLELF